MLPFQGARSSGRARSIRALLSRRGFLGLSTALRQQRIPHPLTPTKYFHSSQTLPLPQQIFPARSPPHPGAPPRFPSRHTYLSPVQSLPHSSAPAAHSNPTSLFHPHPPDMP